MQGSVAILDRTPEEIDDLVSKMLLAVYAEFVYPNRDKNFVIWEAGCDTLDKIGAEIEKDRRKKS